MRDGIEVKSVQMYMLDGARCLYNVGGLEEEETEESGSNLSRRERRLGLKNHENQAASL